MNYHGYPDREMWESGEVASRLQRRWGLSYPSQVNVEAILNMMREDMPFSKAVNLVDDLIANLAFALDESRGGEEPEWIRPTMFADVNLLEDLEPKGE